MSAAAALSQLYALKMLPLPKSEETTVTMEELDGLGRSINQEEEGKTKSEVGSFHTGEFQAFSSLQLF